VLETVNQMKRMDMIYLTQCQVLCSQEYETVYQIAKISVLYIIPLLIMSITYYQIVDVLWKSSNIPGHTETLEMFKANAYNSGKSSCRTPYVTLHRVCVTGVTLGGEGSFYFSAIALYRGFRFNRSHVTIVFKRKFRGTYGIVSLNQVDACRKTAELRSVPF